MRFKVGDRVRHIGQSYMTGVPHGDMGTVAEVAGFKGKSIYADPLRRMIFVKWDHAYPKAVFKNELERVRR